MSLLYSDQAPALVEPMRPAIRRVLLISYHFPPVGGAGVQRPVKFVKYLRRYGWETSVVMASNPSVPVFDESLRDDLPEDLVVAQARTLEPSYGVKQGLAQAKLEDRSTMGAVKGWCRRRVRGAAGLLLQPDPQILWLPAALKAAKGLLGRLPHDAILATAPPFSNLILGGLLKQHSGLPLVVDFRDEWDIANRFLENSSGNWISGRVQEFLQRRVLRQADAIVATTEASAGRLRSRAAAAGSRAGAQCIYNGYDESDFSEPQVPPTDPGSGLRRFRLVYTGTLWNLTSIEPLVVAIERLNHETPEILDRLEILVVGRKTPQQQELLSRIALTHCKLVNTDYCDHKQALKLMRSADGLCLLLSDVHGSERVAPAKLFEYLAARRPILTIAPAGETVDLVRQFYPEGHFLPEDIRGIGAWLAGQVSHFRIPRSEGNVDDRNFDLHAYSREGQAGQLAALLDGLVK